MPTAIAARRREIFAVARPRLADFVRLDPAQLRFSLGTSAADPRVPVLLAPEAERIVSGAAADLALLLSTGHRAFVPADDFDRLVMSEGYAALPAPVPSLGPTGGGVDLRGAARLGSVGHPALLGGILCAWMGPGGRGRSLTALWIEAMGQALAEMAASKEQEETPIIAALALYARTQAAAEGSRDRLPGPPVDGYLRAAQGIGLWVAARTGLARAWRRAGRPESDTLLVKLEALVAPGPLLGRASRLGGATLYGCPLSAGLPRAEESVARLLAGGDPEAAAGDVGAALLGDEELWRRASGAVATARLRGLLLEGIGGAEATGHRERVQDMRELFAAPDGLATALADEGSRRSLRAAARELEPLPGQSGLAFAEIGHALKTFKPREPAASFGLDRSSAAQDYAAAVCAAFCDAALERAVAPARRALALRTGGEAEGGAEAEWEAGRLYRVSARAGPILKQAIQRDHGHLFVDLKDFTRRTSLLGQAATAEFLRTEFYGPILSAAKRFYSGMGHLSDRGGVTLNNLLGDAASFTGDIASLVALAFDVRRLLVQYGERLAREVSGDAVARNVAALEERFGKELAGVRAELAAAREQASTAAAGSAGQRAAMARAAQAAAEEGRLAHGREQALARARGEGLEAGIFISFGAAPLVVVLEDEVFGHNRVAVAEKINESARGTSRVMAGRARADAERDAERQARQNPALEHAWSVFIDRPLSLSIPPEVERAALAAARGGDLPAALRALAAPVRSALEAAGREGAESEAGELYNGGAALSQEALDAYLAAAAHDRQVREVVLDPPSLPEALRGRWWFGSRPQPLIATFDRDGKPAELFRKVGRAAMKGLGDVPVWELCGAGGGSQALCAACGPEWLGVKR
jgi:hypothetical protein